MRPSFRPFLATAIALLIAAAGPVLLPGTAHAQFGSFGFGLFSDDSNSADAVGWGLWYGTSRFEVDAALPEATGEVEGYTNVLPAALSSRGPAIGISYGSWGLNLGYNEGEADVQRRADVNQTPGNAADDPLVLTARRTSRTISILVNPLEWLFLGYGTEDGSFEFTQVLPGGTGETRKLSFSHDFYSVGVACCFDPRKGGFGPVFTLYAKFPTKQGDFSGTEYGAGIGVYQ